MPLYSTNHSAVSSYSGIDSAWSASQSGAITSTADILDSYSGTELVLLWSGAATDVQKAALLRACEGATVTDELDDYTLLSFPSNAMLTPALELLRSSELVRAADPNFELSLYGAELEPDSELTLHSIPQASDSELTLQAVTQDPYSDSQWAFDNVGFYTHYGADASSGIMLSNFDIDMNVPAGWSALSSLGTEFSEIIVAIVDTGVDVLHPDLAGQIWTNPGEIPGDGIDNDDNGYIDDVNGWDFYNSDSTVCHYEYDENGITYHALPSDNDNHGTHVAGIIAAAADNEIGIAGIVGSFPVKIMPLKIHGGERGNGSVANAIRAIKYATMMGAKVCNLSWGADSVGNSLETLRLAITESNMLFVAAAGNSGMDNDATPMYPASLKLNNLLSVSFINAFGSLTSESNYGATSVDIAAPGTDIYSTAVGGYSSMSGSSMAVPYVSGIAALLYSAGGAGLYPAAVKNAITGTIRPLTALNGKLLYPGIPDLFQAVIALGSIVPDTLAPVTDIVPSFQQDIISVNLNASDGDGSGVRVIKYSTGTKTLRAFQHGTLGTTVVDSVLRLAKGGNYTFYLSDYAGNETLVHYRLEDDTTAPTFTALSVPSPSGQEYRIVADFSDSQSGIKEVYLLSGEHTARDFPSASRLAALPYDGNSPVSDTTPVSVAPVDGRLLLRILSPGSYTFYSSDYRGNVTVSVITVTPGV